MVSDQTTVPMAADKLLSPCPFHLLLLCYSFCIVWAGDFWNISEICINKKGEAKLAREATEHCMQHQVIKGEQYLKG